MAPLLAIERLSEDLAIVHKAPRHRSHSDKAVVRVSARFGPDGKRFKPDPPVPKGERVDRWSCPRLHRGRDDVGIETSEPLLDRPYDFARAGALLANRVESDADEEIVALALVEGIENPRLALTVSSFLNDSGEHRCRLDIEALLRVDAEVRASGSRCHVGMDLHREAECGKDAEKVELPPCGPVLSGPAASEAAAKIGAMRGRVRLKPPLELLPDRTPIRARRTVQEVEAVLAVFGRRCASALEVVKKG
jgi:hypothetical protein